MLDLSTPPLDQLAPLLSPYLRGRLVSAGEHALAIHADEVGPEHLLTVLMEDEEGAATRAVEHGFADPELVGEEALAISSGLLVVGAEATRPFSTRLREACVRARARASEARRSEVPVALLLEELCAELPASAVETLRKAGLRTDPGPAPAEGAAEGIALEGHLLRSFTDSTKRALSRACRATRRAGDRHLSPGHLLVALIGEEPEHFPPGGEGAGRILAASGEGLDDATPAPPRRLEADEALKAFLALLPAGADSLDALAAMHGPTTPELAQILQRHRLTPEALERARSAFRDPSD